MLITVLNFKSVSTQLGKFYISTYMTPEPEAELFWTEPRSVRLSEILVSDCFYILTNEAQLYS